MKPTIRDVRNFVLTSGVFSAAHTRKVAGRISSYAKKTNRTLDSVADPDLFEHELGKYRRIAIPPGYQSKRQADTAASEIRSAFAHFLAKEINSKKASWKLKHDDWDKIVSSLSRVDLHEKKLIPVHVLIKRCRESGIMPHAVTHEFLMDLIMRSPSSGEYKALQEGWAIVESYADVLSNEIMLPSKLPLPPLVKPRNCCKRYPFPPALAADWTEFCKKIVSPTHEGVVKRERIDGVNQKTMSSYYNGLSYYHTCLITLGYFSADADVDLVSIIDPDIILEIIDTEIDGEFPWDKLSATSLYNYIVRILLIAEAHNIEIGEVRKRVNRYKFFKNVHKMSVSRRAWCQRLIHDQSRVSAFYNLPHNSFKTAFSLMRQYDELSLLEQQSAIKSSIAACAFAILLSLPLRVKTLLQLRHTGPNADVFAFEHKSDLIVNTTADMVKNGYEHNRVRLTPKEGGSSKVIVKWFIEEVHPRLINQHIKPNLRNDQLLFGGIGYARIYHAIVDVAIEHGIDIMPHMFRHGIATLLANEPNADYSLIAALLGNNVDTTVRNYVFLDQAKLHAAGQDRIAEAQKKAVKFRRKK